jgi:hypothetical protein
MSSPAGKSHQGEEVHRASHRNHRRHRKRAGPDVRAIRSISPVMTAGAGQETRAGVVEDPFCQASAAALAAALACAHLNFASWLGGTSISLIHRRVADTRYELPMARPAKVINMPAPTSAPLIMNGPLLISGAASPPPFSVMAPPHASPCDGQCDLPQQRGHHPLRVIGLACR